VKSNGYEQPRGAGKGIFEFLDGAGISTETNSAKAERRGNIYCEICAEHSVRGPNTVQHRNRLWVAFVWKPSLVYGWVV
jgi:hypothetical protein